MAALVGCDDPVGPREQGPYEVATLKTLSEGTAAGFVDLNENRQALWHEGEQAVLWDNGSAREIPVGKFLGPSGEVLGDFSVWIDGQLTELSGFTRGITEDGTIYFSRNDTMFTWRDGVLTTTDLPIGTVGPEGRVWTSGTECKFYLDGEWHLRASGRICNIGVVEENGWAVVWTDAASGYARVVGPNPYDTPSPANHINSEGHTIVLTALMTPEGDEVDLNAFFPGIRLGAINDDGEILAQLDDRVVLLTPH